MSGTLSVWWDGKVVGTLRIDKHGDMAFQYGEEWLADSSEPPLSRSLPKRPETFTRRQCRPFFGGLLPEEGQLEAVARKLGISKTNDFKLLEALGGDVAGALSLWPEGERPRRPMPLHSRRRLMTDVSWSFLMHFRSDRCSWAKTDSVCPWLGRSQSSRWSLPTAKSLCQLQDNRQRTS